MADDPAEDPPPPFLRDERPRLRFPFPPRDERPPSDAAPLATPRPALNAAFPPSAGMHWY